MLSLSLLVLVDIRGAGPSSGDLTLPVSIEEAATTALRRRAAGRVPAFCVRCDTDLNPAGSEDVSFEVVVAPAAPRARSIGLRVAAR